MSQILTKRAFAEASQQIVKKTVLDMADVQAACTALAQLITDQTGVDCRLKLVMDSKALEAAIAAAEKEGPL